MTKLLSWNDKRLDKFKKKTVLLMQPRRGTGFRAFNWPERPSRGWKLKKLLMKIRGKTDLETIIYYNNSLRTKNRLADYSIKQNTVPAKFIHDMITVWPIKHMANPIHANKIKRFNRVLKEYSEFIGETVGLRIGKLAEFDTVKTQKDTRINDLAEAIKSGNKKSTIEKLLPLIQPPKTTAKITTVVAENMAEVYKVSTGEIIRQDNSVDWLMDMLSMEMAAVQELEEDISLDDLESELGEFVDVEFNE